MQVNGVPLVQLPEKKIHVIKVDMTRSQRTKYNAWMGAGRTVVRNFIAADTLMQNWAHVLQILTRCAALHCCRCVSCAVRFLYTQKLDPTHINCCT